MIYPDGFRRSVRPMDEADIQAIFDSDRERFLGNTKHLAAVVRGAPHWDGRTYLAYMSTNPDQLRAWNEQADSETAEYLRAMEAA